jgi:uncharacterized protein YjlB
MADIILEPGEMFEHYHSDESSSVLVRGNAVIEMDGGCRIHMDIGKTVVVQAGVSHCMVNTGAAEAVIRCAKHSPR